MSTALGVVLRPLCNQFFGEAFRQIVSAGTAGDGTAHRGVERPADGIRVLNRGGNIVGSGIGDGQPACDGEEDGPDDALCEAGSKFLCHGSPPDARSSLADVGRIWRARPYPYGGITYLNNSELLEFPETFAYGATEPAAEACDNVYSATRRISRWLADVSCGPVSASRFPASG